PVGVLDHDRLGDSVAGHVRCLRRPCRALRLGMTKQLVPHRMAVKIVAKRRGDAHHAPFITLRNTSPPCPSCFSTPASCGGAHWNVACSSGPRITASVSE